MLKIQSVLRLTRLFLLNLSLKANTKIGMNKFKGRHEKHQLAYLNNNNYN
jgi:hypothetical protein